MPRLLTPDEAAAILEVNVKTLLKWSRDSYVPAHGLGEGRRRLWRYFEHELLEFVGRQPNGKERRNG